MTPPRRGPARRRANPPAACWRPHAAARDVVPDLRTGRSTAARAPAPNLRLGWPPRPVGPTLDLVRGEPVRITVVNRLPEPTAVHWHGIELESYYDGVPGFSGLGRRTTPLIAPGDLRLELRAGVRWPGPSVLLTQLPIRVTPAADHRRP